MVLSHLISRWYCTTLTSTLTMTSRLRTGATGLVRPRRWGRNQYFSSQLIYHLKTGEGDQVHLRGHYRGGHPPGWQSLDWPFSLLESCQILMQQLAMLAYIIYTNLNFQVALEKLKLEQVNFKFSDSIPWTISYPLSMYLRMSRARMKMTPRRKRMLPGCWRRLLELNWRRSW